MVHIEENYNVCVDSDMQMDEEDDNQTMVDIEEDNNVCVDSDSMQMDEEDDDAITAVASCIQQKVIVLE